ncbi:MAG TPA: hypothetical protein VGC92_05985 [Phenylobacterium sp.]|jgi:hypothetical protein
MAGVSPTPLKTEAEYERALCEVERILEEPHEDGVEDRYFAYLLGRIADYHETLPPPKRDANLDRLSELEQRLAAFGKRLPKPHGIDGDHHWSPLLGGDVDPSHRRD